MLGVGLTKGLWAMGVGAVGCAAIIANRGQDQVRVAAEPIRGDGIGRLVLGLEATTLDGGKCSIENKGTKATVVAFTDVSCPLTKKYASTLAALEEKYSKHGVRFVFVNPNKADDEKAIRSEIKHHGLDGEYVHDKDGRVTASLGAKTTTEVFVLDARSTLVYRGAVDDQYGFGYQTDAPKNTFLINALDAVLAGNTPKVEATTAPGCALIVDAKPVMRAVTYHDQVSRILQRNCVPCHRDGGVGPFALDNYAKAEAFKGMIKQVVNNGTMPPWFAAPTADGHSPWANDRTMSKRDKDDLNTWIDAGCPEGDAKLAPAPLKFHNEWAIGEPDVVYEIPRAIPVRATGQMPYYHVRIDPGFTEDKWIDAMELHPTDRSVVHHVLVFVVEDGRVGGRGLLDVDESTGFLMGYVPGTDSVVFPEGQAKRVPKGAALLFQIHYTPNGKATQDQTKLAVRFAKSPPKHEIQVYGVVNKTFAIPPGAPAHSDTKTVTIPKDMYVTALMPHMHVRGKAFKYEVQYPDGKKEVLLDVPAYDFNWQITYRYVVPKLLPAGTRLTATGTFDNSDKNPANPDPSKTVRWGLQTTEEMLLGYVEFYVPSVKPGTTVTLDGG